jgi:hypothetical protein
LKEEGGAAHGSAIEMDGVGGGGGIRTTVRHFRREAAADKMHTDPSNIYGDSFSTSYPPCIVCFLYSLQRKCELQERAAFSYFHVFLSFIFLSLLLYFFSLYRAKKENDRLSIAYTQRATHK